MKHLLYNLSCVIVVLLYSYYINYTTSTDYSLKIPFTLGWYDINVKLIILLLYYITI